MKVLCYGDSNTYGYDPCSYLADRYPSGHRWVDELARLTGWDIINDGMNGRGVPAYSVAFPQHIHFLIIMLGTNDLLQGREVSVIAERMKKLLSACKNQFNHIYLVSVPQIQFGAWVNDVHIIDAVKALNARYEIIAEEMDISYVDTEDWKIEMTYDGVHFSANGHLEFARKLYECIIQREFMKME